jgi:hypothetical protein
MIEKKNSSTLKHLWSPEKSQALLEEQEQLFQWAISNHDPQHKYSNNGISEVDCTLVILIIWF